MLGLKCWFRFNLIFSRSCFFPICFAFWCLSTVFLKYGCVCVCCLQIDTSYFIGITDFYFSEKDTSRDTSFVHIIMLTLSTWHWLTSKWLQAGFERPGKHLTDICWQVQSGVSLSSGCETHPAGSPFHLVTADAGQGQGHRVHRSRWRLGDRLAASASHVLPGGQPAVLFTGNTPE